MSFFNREGGLVTRKPQESKESLIKHLLNKEEIETKTEIPNILNMSIADVIAFYYGTQEQQHRQVNDMKKILGVPARKGKDGEDLEEISSGDVIGFLLFRYRVNAVNHGRGSRIEAMGALQSAEMEEQKQSRLFRGMFGG